MHPITRTTTSVLAVLVASTLLAGCQDTFRPMVPAPSSESPTASANPAPSDIDQTPYMTTYRSLSFTTPWGAWCAMLPRHEPTPGTPAAGCWEITGKQQILSVNAGAKAEVKQVKQGFYVYERGPALPAGARLELDGVTCAQAAADLICTAGGHGFTLRPDNTFDLR